MRVSGAKGRNRKYRTGSFVASQFNEAFRMVQELSSNPEDLRTFVLKKEADTKKIIEVRVSCKLWYIRHDIPNDIACSPQL